MSNTASLSVIIPNHNAQTTIGECLSAAFASEFDNFEVIVADDASTDGSVKIITNTKAKLVELKEHAGVSAARNIGARNANGDILLFIDADCLLEKDALSLVETSINDDTPIIGGTYTPLPHDSENFFSTFQSIFINYNETRGQPDYIAAHCLAIEKAAFEESGGFIENSYMGVAAGVEDVELSHRLKKSGHTLKMNQDILVRHIFNFNLAKSLKNAFKKSKIWTMYSLDNKDIFRDSCTASRGLKFNVFCYFSGITLALLYMIGTTAAIAAIFLISTANVLLNRGLIGAFYSAKGPLFTTKASAYYFLVYPLAVGIGSLAGLVKYLWEIKIKRRHA